MTVIHIIAVTRNKSVVGTTLHSMMNLNMLCMLKQMHLEIHFVEDKTGLPKIIKSGERIIFFDYGTNVDENHLVKLVDPFEKGVQVLVVPSVKEGINWDRFVKKTKEGSTEPVNQRGLEFDTVVGKKLSDGLYEVASTSARVWAMDARPVDKKLRGGKIPVSLPLHDNEKMFECLKNLGIKVGALTTATVICHYVYECFGNILEAAGVKLEP